MKWGSAKSPTEIIGKMPSEQASTVGKMHCFQCWHCLRILCWNQFLMTKTECCFLLFSKWWFPKVYVSEENTFIRQETATVMGHWRVTRRVCYKISGLICHQGRPGRSGQWDTWGDQDVTQHSTRVRIGRADYCRCASKSLSWNGVLSFIISMAWYHAWLERSPGATECKFWKKTQTQVKMYHLTKRAHQIGKLWTTK